MRSTSEVKVYVCVLWRKSHRVYRSCVQRIKTKMFFFYSKYQISSPASVCCIKPSKMISSGVIMVNANRPHLLFLSSAVRFGRIPKREKQRLLDEMQSYMNSLNESASVDMEMSPPSDAPCSPENTTSEGAAPAPQSYSGSLLNSDEKLLKMAASSSNANTVSFRNSSVQEATISHSATQTQTEQDSVTSSYPGQSNCPVSHNIDNNANPKVDNIKYTFPSNQNQCPFSGKLSPQSNSVSHYSFPARESHNQSPCPWKLNGGAKVLVRPLLLSV